jgi:isopenicillin-N epimerase
LGQSFGIDRRAPHVQFAATMASPHTPDIRSLWGLDYSKLIVNHGSYGATPLEVLAAQDDWRRRMEASPTLFMATELPAAIRKAADAVGAAIGARGEDIALVDNSTAAINAILGSIPFAPGDEILVNDHTYGAVLKTARHIAARTGAVIVTAKLPFPDPTAETLIAAHLDAVTPRTRLAIVDHITSPSALVMPLATMVAAFRDAGVPVLVDGAHGPGHVPLDMAAIGADYYVGNGHKWWMGAKGAGFLWAAPQHQAGLHPTIISHGYGSGFLAEFDWTGTRDWSAALALSNAIAFHNRLGGTALMDSNRALARAAAEKLAARFATRTASPADLEGAMSLVELPFGGPATDERALALRHMFYDLGCDIPIHMLAGTIWLRLSAQAYNLSSDYDRLGDLVDMVRQRTI